MKGTAHVEGQLAAEAELTFAFAEVKRPRSSSSAAARCSTSGCTARRKSRDGRGVKVRAGGAARARRPVFVRGVGAVTPLGADWPSSLAALAAGACAIAPVTTFDVTGFPSTVAAAVPERFFPAAAHPDRRWTLLAPAADEAWRQARIEAPAARIGVFLGAESGRSSFATVVALARAAGGGDTFDARAFGAGGAALAPTLDPHVVSPAAVTSALARRLGAAGPAVTVSLACASSAAATRRGRARSVLASATSRSAAAWARTSIRSCSPASASWAALSARGVVLSVRRAPRRVRGRRGRGGRRPGGGARPGSPRARGRGALTRRLSPDRARSRGRRRRARDARRAGGRGRGGRRLRAGAWNIDAAQRRRRGSGAPAGARTLARGGARIVDQGRARPRDRGRGCCSAFCPPARPSSTGACCRRPGLREPDAACALPHVRGRALVRPVRTALVNAFAFGGANTSLVLRGVA